MAGCASLLHIVILGPRQPGDTSADAGARDPLTLAAMSYVKLDPDDYRQVEVQHSDGLWSGYVRYTTGLARDEAGLVRGRAQQGGPVRMSVREHK